MKQLHEDQVIGVEINLEELKQNDQLNESFLHMFGSWISFILKALMGAPLYGSSNNINVKGKKEDVVAFATAIGNEKKYIEIAKKHGLQDPQTYKQKSKLDAAVKGFEKVTGIKWPFK
tara:strand:+ start:306 stop:659 length:354 start_codon:yes stop_codon:yes gene_type:complete